MLLSMMPIIQELEGSLKRNDMQAQMEIMGHEVTLLSESGLPGDSSEVELIPVDGELRWDRLRGGMWYSASWYQDDTFRIQGASIWTDTSMYDMLKVTCKQFAMKT